MLKQENKQDRQRIRRPFVIRVGAARPVRNRDRRVQSPDIRAAGGFTLLEMLIVLSLVAIIAAIAAPNMERLYAGIGTKTDREYILDQFTDLGLKAMHDRQAYVVLSSAPHESQVLTAHQGATEQSIAVTAKPFEVDLPEGWTIRFNQPLFISASGVCLGANLALHREGTVEIQVTLEPPYCHVDVHG